MASASLRRPLLSPSLPHLLRPISSATTRPTWGDAAQSIMRQGHTEKKIGDHLYPMPAHQLATLLSDILPETSKRYPSHPTIQPTPAVLPPGSHLVYFPPLVSASELAPDGAEADHVPPHFKLATPEDTEGGKRLWVGGEITFKKGWRSNLRIDGRAMTCFERVGQVDARHNGAKTFVDIARSYCLGDELKAAEIEERRTLCFVKEDIKRDADDPSTLKILPSNMEPTASYSFSLNPAQLFQFSALTYNAHFIHLGRKDALVHGPLTLALMLRVLNLHRGATVKHLSYRNIAPLYVGQQARVCVRQPAQLDVAKEMWDVWIEGPEGGMLAKGRAQMNE